MTIQQQADAILSRPTVREICKAHDVKTLDQQDELLVRMAQDREALLKACKEMRTPVLLAAEKFQHEGNDNAFGDCMAIERRAMKAIAQAERP